MTNVDNIKKSIDILSGKWLYAILAFLIVAFISGVPQQISPKLSVLTILLAGAMAIGNAIYFLKIVRGQEASFENLFDGFKQYVPSVIAYFLVAVIVVVGLILLVVPGVILGLGLSQTFFIMADDKDIPAVDAMKKSWAMMDGYKLKFFLLQLLHFLVVMAGIIALVIGVFFSFAIVNTSNALFYESLKNGSIDS